MCNKLGVHTCMMSVICDECNKCGVHMRSVMCDEHNKCGVHMISVMCIMSIVYPYDVCDKSDIIMLLCVSVMNVTCVMIVIYVSQIEKEVEDILSKGELDNFEEELDEEMKVRQT